MVQGPVHPIDYLPHRPPFLFLDRILRIEDGRLAAGWKRVTQADCPDGGAFPPSLLVEVMAQTSAALVFRAGDEEAGRIGALAAVPRMEFHGSAVAGDTLVATAELVRQLGGMCRFAVRLEVGGDLVAEGLLVVAVPKEGTWSR